MPKYKLKNGKQVLVRDEDLDLFLKSNDAIDAEVIEEKIKEPKKDKDGVAGADVSSDNAAPSMDLSLGAFLSEQRLKGERKTSPFLEGFEETITEIPTSDFTKDEIIKSEQRKKQIKTDEKKFNDSVFKNITFNNDDSIDDIEGISNNLFEEYKKDLSGKGYKVSLKKPTSKDPGMRGFGTPAATISIQSLTGKDFNLTLMPGMPKSNIKKQIKEVNKYLTQNVFEKKRQQDLSVPFQEETDSFLSQNLTEDGGFNVREKKKPLIGLESSDENIFINQMEAGKKNVPTAGITDGGIIFDDPILGRNIQELNEDPDFIKAVRSNVIEIFKAKNPGKNLPSNRMMDIIVQNTISNKVEGFKEQELLKSLKEKQFLIDQGEYIPFLNESIQADINTATPARQAVMKSRLRQSDLKKLIEDPTINASAKIQYKKEFDSLQKNYSNLLRQADKDYKPFLNLYTGRRIDAATAESLPAEQVENLSENDAMLSKYYNSLPADKLTQEYFRHKFEQKQYLESINKTYKTLPIDQWRSGAKTRALINNEMWSTFSRNEDGSYNVPMEDFLKGGKIVSAFSGVFSENTLDKMSRDRYYLRKDKTDLAKRQEALETTYLMNVDPVSVSEGMNFGSGVVRFGEALTEAFIGEDAQTEFFGTSRRVELDEIKDLLIDSDVLDPNNKEHQDIFADEIKAFERSRAMKVTEGVAEFTPALLQFAVANKVQGALGVTRLIGTMLKSSDLKTRIAGFMLGAAVEELKFKAVTGGESQTGGGAGFYIGGAAARRLMPFNFGSTRIQTIFDKVVAGGLGGASASEVALLSEAFYKEIKNTKAFETSMEEEFGSRGEVFDRFITNSFIFGTVGGQNIKAVRLGSGGKIMLGTDLMSRSQKRNFVEKLQQRIDSNEFKGKELQQKRNQVIAIDAQILKAEQNFNDLDIGSQQQQLNQARELIAENKAFEFDPKTGEWTGRFKEATPEDIRGYEKTIARVQANTAAAMKTVNRYFENVVKSGIVKDGNLNLKITDGGIGLNEKAGYNKETNTFTFDITKFKPGVFAQEAGHLFMNMAFQNNLTLAENFVSLLENNIQGKLESYGNGGKLFTIPGKNNPETGEPIKYTFKEAIKESYGESKRAEEYVMNIVEFLQQKRNREILLQSGTIPELHRQYIKLAQATGLPVNNKTDFKTADKLLESLYSLGTVAEGGTPEAIKKKFEAFRNIVIDGKKLADLDGKELKTDKQIEEDLNSKEINLEEKKDIFSKATRAYEDMINSGQSIEQAGVMVGFEFQPLVESKLRAYMDRNGLNNIGNEVINDIVSDVSLGTGKGSQNIPGLVKSYKRGKELIDYIRDNNPTTAEIQAEISRLGLERSSTKDLIKIAKEGGEATLTSYVFGQIDNKLRFVMKLPQYKNIFNTISLDVQKADQRMAEGGGVPSGFVDVSSPIQNQRVNTQQATTIMGVKPEFIKAADNIGERALLGIELKDLDAKSRGTIGNSDVVMLESNKARVTVDGVTETIKARSPKDVQKFLGTTEKYEKTPTVLNEIVELAKDKLVVEFEKDYKLIDNYTPTPEYEAFVERTFPLLKDYISQSAINKRFAPFKKPIIDPATGKQAREKTAVGKGVFGKENTTIEQWKDYFIGDGTQRIDGRKRSLLETLATEVGFDKVMEKLVDKSMQDQIKSRQEELGVDLVDNYIAIIGKSIDRGINSEMNSKVIEFAKKRNIDPLKVLYTPEGIIRTEEEILKQPGGVEILKIIKELAIQDLRSQKEYIDQEGRVNEDLIKKLQNANIPNAESYKNIRNSSAESIEKFKSDIKNIVSYLPKDVLSLTSAMSSKTEGGVLAAIMGWTSRNVKATGEKLNRKSFIESFENEFGKQELSEGVKKLWTEALELAKENNYEGNGITITTKSRRFTDAASKIAKDKSLSTAEQIEKINKLKGRQEAITDIKVKEKILDATLATIGEIGLKLEGKELESFSESVGKMLLNNDGIGIRRFSSENYIELNQLLGKSKNEHLKSKAKFGAEVIEALLNGELSIEKIKEITSQYNSVIGGKKGQQIADGILGTTVENAERLKMIISKIADGSISNANINALRNFYNWTTGKTAYQEMIESYAEQAKNSILKPEKGVNIENNKLITESELLTPAGSTAELNSKTIMFDNAMEKAKDPNKKPKGISVFDFDDTLARTKSKVTVIFPETKENSELLDVIARRKFKKEFENRPSYKQNFKDLTEAQQLEVLKEAPGNTKKINATEFAKQAEALEAQGAKFDFSEFSKVIQGKLGPLFSEAQKKAGKFTTKDIFVLTARPANSAVAIQKFLKSEGLEIPLENIVGLGNGAPKAKSEWMVGKVAEGYNDFYFADDAIKNVKAVKTALDFFDVKSDVQQAIMNSKEINLSSELNKMIERKKGIPARTKISPAAAANLGSKKGRFDYFVGPNAEDFAGMLYKFYGKGKQGDADMALLKKTLLEPFNRGENAVSSYRQALGNDFKKLAADIGDLKAKMTKETKASLKDSGFNADQAVRVHIWKKLGYKIPGIKKGEINLLDKIVKNDPRLSAFAKGVLGITKTKKAYPEPSDTWFSGNIRYDLIQHTNKGARQQFLKEWIDNVDAMFTPENYNKIEAAYGKGYVDNLKQMIGRMKSGQSRPENLSKEAQQGLDYLNGSIGVIMFLNTRSAILQTTSAINYLNWSDNNPAAVGKTLANPKQFGKMFSELMFSDFLKQRRSGLEINVEEAEIAKAVERSKGKAKVLYDGLIKVGFTPTQLADSFAIALGGTPFVINRTKTYTKAGLTPEAAKQKALEDWRSISEETQQSSRQDRVSNVQTGVLGRLVFAFNNVIMQQSRLFKKAGLDLVNNRGDKKTNISKMVYYGAVQSLIFYSLQQARFLDLFGGDDEDMSQEEKDFNQKIKDKKNKRLFNAMLDSFLSGTGLPGKVTSTAQKTYMQYLKEQPKGYQADYANVLFEAMSISPPVSSKFKKSYSAAKTFKYYSTKKGKEELKQYGKYAIDNPILNAKARVFSAWSNIPVDRTLNKMNNLDTAINNDSIATVKRVSQAAGWDKWSLDFYEKVFVPVAEQEAQKRKNRAEGVKKAKETRERNKKRKQDSIIKARSMMSTEQLLEDLRKQLNSK